MLSKLILMAKIMKKKNFKIQMLAGNRLKIHVGASSQISTPLDAAGAENLKIGVSKMPKNYILCIFFQCGFQ